MTKQWMVTLLGSLLCAGLSHASITMAEGGAVTARAYQA